MRIQSIQAMNYPDFVAAIGQENVPPGGSSTVDWWLKQAPVKASDHVLDLACTTGFSGQYVHARSGCRISGVDLSELAIVEARRRCDRKFDPQSFTYLAGDACRMPFPSQSFSHILGGCNFSFIQDRGTAVKEAARVLRPGGRLCISNFFYSQSPDAEILNGVESVLGFRPRAEWTADFWNSLFSSYFTLEQSQTILLSPAADHQIYNTVLNQMTSSPEILCREPGEQKQIFDRLLNTRLTLNRHRAYQSIALQIWRKA